MLAGLDAVLDAGFAPVKVNAVALEGIEDDLEDFVELARERPVHVRFIEFMPIGLRVGGLWRFVSAQASAGGARSDSADLRAGGLAGRRRPGPLFPVRRAPRGPSVLSVP